MVTRCLVAFWALLALASCGGGPVSPSENTTQSFSDTVPLQNSKIHSFDVPNLGEFNVKLTALSPGGGAVIGIIWGQFVNGSCSPIQTQSAGASSVGRTVLSGPVYLKGAYCVQVFDPALLGGTPLAVPQNYTIEVSHP
jgi:hypothetical protein